MSVKQIAILLGFYRAPNTEQLGTAGVPRTEGTIVQISSPRWSKLTNQSTLISTDLLLRRTTPKSYIVDRFLDCLFYTNLSKGRSREGGATT